MASLEPPTFKPEAVECVCGCGMVARPRARAWKDGLGPHVKGCQCKRCMAPRYKQRASAREHKVGKAVGGTRNIGSGAFGGSDVVGGICEVEETSNQDIVRGVKRWWFNKGTQAKVSRLYEHRLKPRVFVASWDGKPKLAVLTWDDFVDLCKMAVEQRDDAA